MSRPLECFHRFPPAVVWFCCLLYLFTTGGRLGTWDAEVYYAVTERFLTEGRLDVPREIIQSHEEWKGRGGRYYAPFDLGQSVLNIPFYLAGRALANLAASHRSAELRDLIVRGSVAGANAIVTALTVWCVWAMAGALGWDRRGRTGAALMFGVATMAWPYACFGFNQPLAALGQTLGIWGAVRHLRSRAPRDAFLAGGGVALGIFARLNVILAAPWIALLLLAAHWPVLSRASPPNSDAAPFTSASGNDSSFDRERAHGRVGSDRVSFRLARTLGVFLAPVALSLALALLYNVFRFEALFRTGYAGDSNADFDVRFVFGHLSALLLSPSKGVLFYVPIALLAAVEGVFGWRAASSKTSGDECEGRYCQ